MDDCGRLSHPHVTRNYSAMFLFNYCITLEDEGGKNVNAQNFSPKLGRQDDTYFFVLFPDGTNPASDYNWAELSTAWLIPLCIFNNGTKTKVLKNDDKVGISREYSVGEVNLIR